jgi:hypothetical protein
LALAEANRTHHMSVMSLRSRWKLLLQVPAVRLVILLFGSLCMICAPLVSPLPGPGGVVLFAIGLGLVLQTSAWARRRYVRFKRRYPRQGGWTDWGLRRKSHKRREELRKKASGD